MSQVAIRVATSADAPVLAEHRVRMFSDMGQVDAALEPSLCDASRAAIAELMAAGEYLGWLAIANDECIGGAGALIRRLVPRPTATGIIDGPEAVILNVYVTPSWRRRGVARLLMKTVLDSLRQRGIPRVVLHASPDGRSLYEELGFRPTNEMLLVDGANGS